MIEDNSSTLENIWTQVRRKREDGKITMKNFIISSLRHILLTPKIKKMRWVGM
jgi:hypothetical protein